MNIGNSREKTRNSMGKRRDRPRQNSIAERKSLLKKEKFSHFSFSHSYESEYEFFLEFLTFLKFVEKCLESISSRGYLEQLI